MDGNDIEFALDADLCIRCGACVADCVCGVFDMTASGPTPARADACFACQHCLAVCPTGAIAILGKKPADSLPVRPLVDAEAMKRLMFGRRSIRHFKDEDLPRELLRELIDVAWHAPTGVNTQNLHFSVVAGRAALRRLRAVVYDRLAEMLTRGGAAEPDGGSHFWSKAVKDWRESDVDMVFRDAPHLVVVSTGPDAACPGADPFIALSYLELYAQTKNVGVTWCGLAHRALKSIDAEDILSELGMPKGYSMAYSMLLGWPRYVYSRGVQRGRAPLTLYGA